MCRLTHSLLDPRKCTGKEIWRLARERTGAPDPTEIFMSDMKFLMTMARRGCDGCSNHPRIRTPRWEFSGMRLCPDCFQYCTVREYEIDPHHYDGLPYIETQGLAYGLQSFSYRSYLWLHVRNRERYARRDHDVRITSFKNKMKVYRSLQRACTERIRQKRRIDIDRYLQCHMPDTSWKNSPAYYKACKLALPLTERSALLLTKRLMTITAVT